MCLRRRELFVLRARGGTQHGEPEDLGGVRSSWSRAGEAGGEARLQTQQVGERRGWRRGKARDVVGWGEAAKALVGQQGFEFYSSFLSADSEGHFHQHAGLVRSLTPFQRAIKKTTTISLLFVFIEV